MKPGELRKRLREGNVPALLFLYGEETFFIDRILQDVLELTVPAEARDFNYQVYYGRDCRACDVLDAARTLPAFSHRRLVVVRNAQLLASSELERFLDYLKEPVPETVLVFVGDKIDGRRKFYQEFKKRGTLVECKKLYDNQIPAFVKDQLRAAGLSMTEEGLALFCKRAGGNLQEICGELSKLRNYLGERTVIDVGDVAAVVSDSRVDSVFDLTDALGRRDSGEALRLLHRLLVEGVAPLLILAMIARHFRQLWKARDLLDKRTPQKDMARRVGINPYFLQGILKQAQHFPLDRFRLVFEELLEADLALKSSGGHPVAVLERAILRLTAGK
jgi:DNA polymerase-3 subunit delta